MSHTHTLRQPVDTTAAALMPLLCFCWGFTHVVAKLTAPGVSLVMQSGLRSAIAAVLLVLAHRRGIPLFERDAPRGLPGTARREGGEEQTAGRP